MADDRDNVVLRLLREIRSEQTRQGGDLTYLKRQLEEMREPMVTSAGLAMHSNVVAEKSGLRFDELRDEIAALKRRVADLEAAQ